MKKDEPLVSAAELEALIHGWGSKTQAKSVDKFFALRYWFVCLVAASYAIALLFSPGKVAQTLSVHPVEIARITNFLYFRDANKNGKTIQQCNKCERIHTSGCSIVTSRC